ncbi:hypothetical protein F5Y00DRAFT_265150 [Daldinia vernicosa]|uniref:uncharacterized protein n=1 Tax=Daldinia vernicosa TaxID=114800 RepID=UPI0020080665|nr:uncharacterized protein F5Y00DRAFT_265150 [Daldinia vernicosa]KAI0845816.1 hypothetical protein F5Y00DRAFT_265150 [Daldinia vernicosa]
MEHTKLVKNNSTAGYFGNFPVELIQEIMCHLDWNSLKKMILLSSTFLSVFQGAEETILYHIAAKKLGTDVLEVALVRYASTIPALRESIDIQVESRTRPIDTTVTFNGTQRTFNTGRFRMPAKSFTVEVFREIMSFHEKIAMLLTDYEDWLLETHAAFDAHYTDWLTHRTPREKDHVDIALYTAEIARLLYPNDYNETFKTPFIVRFGVVSAEWVIIEHEPKDDPPFAVTGQSLGESERLLARMVGSLGWAF